MKTGTRFICFTTLVVLLAAAAPLAFGQEASGAGGPPIQFFVNSTFATGTAPRSMIAADFNNDGILDLAMANAKSDGSGPNGISVLLGKKGHAFGPPIDSKEGGFPIALAVGDFNRDGKLDLAAADFTPGTVTIMEGNGDGTFQKKSVINVGPNEFAAGVAVGDFNGDGKLDLAVSIVGITSNSVAIALGNGDGTFQSPFFLTGGHFPTPIAIGDFNNDGKVDVAVGNENDDTVSIFLGNGDGTFQPQQIFATGSFPTSIAVADLNGDGKLDLALTDENTGVVAVVLGNGDGTFQPHRDFSARLSPGFVVVGDLNRDGKLDLAVTNFDGTITILAGNGDGTFRAPVSFQAGQSPTGLALGDFNRDGRLDLAFPDFNQNTVEVLLQK